ncbi:class E sortase [Candidatus Saccharibacteria bacterium]|nr:class E sortase [Candidatus Saccharibacteria bacterium]
MDSNNGGLSSSERQRQTAAELAREKVIASYSASNLEASKERTTSHVKQKTVTDEEWKKYHSAWQNYYQKYYSEYYANAAKQYVATEKLKSERRKNEGIEEEEKAVEPPRPSSIISSAATEAEEESIKETLRKKIRKKATENAKKSRRHRRLFPIFSGIAVVLIILFLQYNRLIFAPIMAYVSPGNSSSDGITAIDPTISQPVGPEPKLIIPKLNVDVPVHFGIDSSQVMEAMNTGVAHYMIPGANAFPGQIGNLVITGHSAGDIYSNIQYKFIFSGLERLENGDLIYINYESTRYTYSVVKKETVEPSNVAAVTPDTDKPQLILVTCTPLGTSRYRLLVTAEQINPSYENSPTQEPSIEIADDSNNLPSNEPSFFEKIWNWLTGQSNN